VLEQRSNRSNRGRKRGRRVVVEVTYTSTTRWSSNRIEKDRKDPYI